MRTLKCFTLLVVVVCCVLCVKATGPGPSSERKTNEGSLQGNIIDAVTRKPLAGVTVSLQGSKSSLSDQSTQSDAQGYFKFGKLAAGEVTLLFEKKGFKTYKSDTQTIRDGAVRMNIEVQPVEEEVFETWHPMRKFMDLD